MSENMKSERIGEEGYNNFGSKMIITEYINNRKILVEFQDKYKAKVYSTYSHFKNHKIANPYDRTVYNIGYLGENKKQCDRIIYNEWFQMLQRCYDPYHLNKCPTYIDCFVCDEWHNFQNFAKWYEENYYECNNEKMNLDKDILCKGNKIYSPQTCVFVPQRINLLFVKRDNYRGNLPIGCDIHKASNTIRVRCNIIENEKIKRKCLGYFSIDKPFQAFTCYKNFKENYIKQVADEYKDLIPMKLYDAMYRYEVEIND